MNELLTFDHREIDDLISRLFQSFDDGTELDVFKNLDYVWARLAIHIRAEHLHLFPAILNGVESKDPAAVNSMKKIIDRLHSDHDFFIRELAAAVKIMRELVFFEQDRSEIIPIVREKVSAVCELLKTHNEIEETQAYVWAEELVDQSERSVLGSKIQHELENIPPRFGGDRSGLTNLTFE